MASTTANAPEHPAPHRAAASLGKLVAGIVVAPAAWTTQLLVAYTLTAHACFPGDRALAEPLWSHLRTGLAALSVAATIAALAAMAISYASWARTRREKPGPGHRLMSNGDGRTRFLAMWGLLSSGLFLVAIGFETVALWLSPLCRG